MSAKLNVPYTYTVIDYVLRLVHVLFLLFFLLVEKYSVPDDIVWL